MRERKGKERKIWYISDGGLGAVHPLLHVPLSGFAFMKSWEGFDHRNIKS